VTAAETVTPAAADARTYCPGQPSGRVARVLTWPFTSVVAEFWAKLTEQPPGPLIWKKVATTGGDTGWLN
jgi:hypothetical protein